MVLAALMREWTGGWQEEKERPHTFVSCSDGFIDNTGIVERGTIAWCWLRQNQKKKHAKQDVIA